MVDHDYEFGAREHKWRWLERNRLAFLVRAYPAPLLLLLAPALLATELALLAVSISGGWGGQKLRRQPRSAALAAAPARASVVRSSATRTVSAAEFASWLTPDLDSPFISPLARSLPARLILRTYWRLVRTLLSGFEGLPGRGGASCTFSPPSIAETTDDLEKVK